MIKQRSLLTFILLSIVTCGIYGIVFMYKYAEDVNTVCAGDGKHTQNYIVAILLSIITCGIYSFVWYYGIGNRLQENAPRYGINFSENGTTVLLWMILGSYIVIGPFVAMNILIKNMNALGQAYNAHANNANAAQ